MNSDTLLPRAADLAKAALRRLSNDRLEPTPENYARAYALEAGQTPPPTSEVAPPVPLADWIERVVRGLERGGRHWTSARKKDSLKHVLDGSRGDLQRLQQRLGQLLNGWERDLPDESPVDADALPAAGDAPTPVDTLPRNPAAGREGVPTQAGDLTASTLAPERPGAAPEPWHRLVGRLGDTVEVALPPRDPVADGLADELSRLRQRVLAEGADADDAAALAEVCDRADLLLAHRHHLVEQLAALCEELTRSLADLAEDDSWARGQCEAMRQAVEDGLNARGVRSVTELLRVTRERQGRLRVEREQARQALKAFIHQMLDEVAALGRHTGRFHDSVGRYAEVIERADTLESLAGAVREMVVDSRTIGELVGQARQRMDDEHARATALSQRVDVLEHELRRLSDEVATDQLTQVANRRGLAAAFELERARQARQGGDLCVALLDVDNFKRLNDELGHAAGDVALRSLAALVTRTLRPTDHVARYGGEEFVLLLPATPLAEAQAVLTRLQRALTGGLFMHEQRQVFVTFSAGVTLLRAGETLDDALNRADQALYEAKGSGKNRTSAV
jgi:diguanylate cyclase